MGFWSGIGRVCSFICSGISHAVSSVCSGLSNFASKAISSVGKFLADKAGAFLGLVAGLSLGPLGPVLGPVIGQLVWKVAEKVIVFLAKKLGVIKEKDTPEEIGYRLEEANEHEDWKKQEEFDSFEEYYEYLKIQIPDESINYAKLKNEEDKKRYAAMGMMALTKGCEEHMGIQLPADFLFEVGKSRMEPSEVQAFADAFKNLGYGSVNVRDYFDGKLSPEKAQEMTDMLVETMQKYYPTKSEDAIYSRIGVMNAVSRDDTLLKGQYLKEMQELEKTGVLPDPKI